MNLIFSTFHFSLIYLILCFFLGCSSTGNLQKQDYSSRESKEDPAIITSEKEPVTHMKIYYGNKSSKVSLLVDVNSQDVNIKMSGSPKKIQAKKFPWLDNQEKEPDTPEESIEPGFKKKKTSEKPKKTDEDEWNEVMDIAKGGDLSNSEMQSVLAEMRKAQEFFYKKQYPEALDMAKFSLQKKETAEGHALMGSILYMMGDKIAAKESWMQCLRLHPDMPAVSSMIEKVNRE